VKCAQFRLAVGTAQFLDIGIANEAAQILDVSREDFWMELQLTVEMSPLVYGNC
jgi:hypothetical protein